MTTLALISLEAWDDTWRRNQHLAVALLRRSSMNTMIFVEPARRSPGPDREVVPGIHVHTPRRRLPLRLGGAREVAYHLKSEVLNEVDLLWINDPVVGLHCLSETPCLYDVTDDWRSLAAPRRVLKRLVAAEDRLAQCATTVVCSTVLQERWWARYGVKAYLVPNAVDRQAYRQASVRPLEGFSPHIGYVGSLHQERLDVDLVVSLGADPRIGTLHLVGPDFFDAATRARLARAKGVMQHGPVPSGDVPSWMASLDVLVSPHVISSFTLSLDAIKAYEYLASGKPVVATPTSGFQHLNSQVRLATREDFADAVVAAVDSWDMPPESPQTWDDRAAEMSSVIERLLR